MRLPFLDTFKHKKEPLTLFIAFMVFLSAFTCEYSLFDTMQEADIFSNNKYEERDSDGVYAEKASNLDSVLVSPAFFLPLPDTLLEVVPCFFSPNKILVTTFSVLRC